MRALRPAMAVVDPVVTDTLHSSITVCAEFDVLSHAIESYTALPSTSRAPPKSPHLRPLSQGSNPWADIGCLEALRLIGRSMGRAVSDSSDTEARRAMMFAALLAGISFGNSGVHLPHGMAYSLAGLVGDFCSTGYVAPTGSRWEEGHLAGLVPHRMSVIVNAPSCFRFTAASSPERHLQAALGRCWPVPRPFSLLQLNAFVVLLTNQILTLKTNKPIGRGDHAVDAGQFPRLSHRCSWMNA